MQDTKHTPGPWFQGEALDCDYPDPLTCIDSDTPLRVCVFADGCVPKPKDLNLMMAAPDMLAALNGLVESIHACPIDLTGHVGLGDALRALAKAEGRAS